MSILIPGNRPQLDPARVRMIANDEIDKDAALFGKELRAACPVKVLAVRGYFRDSMGAKGCNDVGLFDDAAFLISGANVYPFNWNADPSKVGWNDALGKPYAMLCEGIYPFIPGPHKGKGPAWRQPDEEQAGDIGLQGYFTDYRARGHFRVYRDRSLQHDPAAIQAGYYAINIHWGGSAGTSSWGCQTAPPAQWEEFRKLSYRLAKNQPWLPYILIDRNASGLDV